MTTKRCGNTVSGISWLISNYLKSTYSQLNFDLYWALNISLCYCFTSICQTMFKMVMYDHIMVAKSPIIWWSLRDEFHFYCCVMSSQYFLVTGENVELAFSIIAKQIYAMLEDGRLTISEGWDGIKRGRGSEVPRDNFQIREDQQTRSGCCSWLLNPSGSAGYL